MELFHENRTLVHTGKFLQEEGSADQSEGESTDQQETKPADRRTELFALLFDNYCESSVHRLHSSLVPITSLTVVLTIPRKENEVTKYHVYRQAGHLEFFVELNFYLLYSPSL